MADTVMQKLKTFSPLFQAIIAFCTLLATLGFVFSLLFAPVKTEIY